MAIYTCTTEVGALSAQQRAVIAAEITRIQTAHTEDRPNMVWVIFQTVSRDSIYSGGKPAVKALIVGLFREDRSTEVKAQVLKELWSMYKKVTGLADDQLWVSLTEIAASDAMMFGAILPEPGHEAEWLASLGRTRQ
jgi:phenylpyruvate tautomerase PptA (4-oxalocrotonate tautomerase family)